MELSGKSGERFRAAIGAVIRTAPAFPTVAMILTEMDRLVVGHREQREWLTEGEAYEIGKRNAARLAVEGLPSDGMLRARGGGRVHVVGAKEHRMWVEMYDKLLALLERRIALREAEARERPDDAELARRLTVLVRTVAETQERRDHFAKTGETLLLGELVTA